MVEQRPSDSAIGMKRRRKMLVFAGETRLSAVEREALQRCMAHMGSSLVGINAWRFECIC